MHSESSRTGIRCQLLTHAMMFWSTRGCFSVFCTDLYYVSPKVTEKYYSFLRLVQNNQTQHQSCPFFLFLTWSCDSDLFNNTHSSAFTIKNHKKTGSVIMVALYVPLDCLWCSMQLHVSWRLVMNPKSFEERWENMPKSCWICFWNVKKRPLEKEVVNHVKCSVVLMYALEVLNVYQCSLAII